MRPPLEGAPDNDQRARLLSWMRDLTRICRLHRISIVDDAGGDGDPIQIFDYERGTIVGLGLLCWLAEMPDVQPGVLVAVEVEDSILDGVWPVDSAEGGIVEQRHQSQGEAS